MNLYLDAFVVQLIKKRLDQTDERLKVRNIAVL